MRLNSYLLTLPALLLACLPLVASDPPAARPMDPPAAYSIDPPAALVEAPPEPKYDPKAATCVVNWKQYLGSGTCIASEGGKSLVLTCNHVWSEQSSPGAPFPLGSYPLFGEVRHDGKTYSATAIAGDADADLALVVVDAPLPVARIATQTPAVGAKVRHYGMTSKDTSGEVLPARTDISAAAHQFAFTTSAIPGDSGAGVFDERGELVAVVCGRTGMATSAPARGPSVTVIRSVVVHHTRAFPHLFPRLRDRLAARSASNAVPSYLPDPPAAVAPKAVPVAPKKVSADPANGCPNGTCPLPSAQFGSGSCANGQCAPAARGIFRRR